MKRRPSIGITSSWIFLWKLFRKIYLCLLKGKSTITLHCSYPIEPRTLFPSHYPPLTLFLSRESCDRFKSTAIVSGKWWPLMDFNVDSASINNELVGSWWTWRAMNIYGEINGYRTVVEMTFFFVLFSSWRSINFYKRISNNWDTENHLLFESLAKFN